MFLSYLCLADETELFNSEQIHCKNFFWELLRQYILATLESCSKFQSQGFNFLTAEAGHASAHGRCRKSKRARLAVPGSEEAEEEIFTTFKWNQYICN